MRIEVNETPANLSMEKPAAISQDVWQWLSCQPLNALAAYLEGTTWEWKPGSTEYCEPHIFYDDDSKSYARLWVGHGLVVEQNKVAVTLHTCDRDGNWDYGDAMDVDEPGFAQWFDKQFGEGFAMAQWQGLYEYLNYVFLTGDDHLNELMVLRSMLQRDWWLQLRWTPQLGLQCLGGECIGVTPGMVEFERLPEEVQMYVKVSKSDFKCWQDFYVTLMGFPATDQYRACPVITYRATDIRVPNETEDEHKARVKKHAALALAALRSSHPTARS